jgi:hypothetical protein
LLFDLEANIIVFKILCVLVKFKEKDIRKSTKIVSLPADYYQRCDEAIFNHLI